MPIEPCTADMPLVENRRTLVPHQQAMTADVVVVGAGPAGCAAAYDLAGSGCGVLLLDRCRFPRRKPCAGGLTVKARRSLRYSVAPVVQQTIFDLSVSHRQRKPALLQCDDPICHLVERPAFDHYCLNQTIATGVRFDRVMRIERVKETDEAVSLVTDAGHIRTRYLIGADGAHSRIRKLTGRFPWHRTAFAVEGIIGHLRRRTPAMGFDFDQVSGGYGWVFPKRDHINIGLYCRHTDVPLSGQALRQYANERFGVALPGLVAGYPLGTGGERYRPGNGRVMLVGDAAGLVEPLLGEGLYNAIRSGQLAAAAVIKALGSGGDACRLYAQALAPVQADLRFSKMAATLFYGLPRCGHLLLTSWLVRVALMRGFAQGLPLSVIFRYAYRYWLGRTIRDPGRFVGR